MATWPHPPSCFKYISSPSTTVADTLANPFEVNGHLANELIPKNNTLKSLPDFYTNCSILPACVQHLTIYQWVL